jgi:mycothiol system anti-sigma-R factor
MHCREEIETLYRYLDHELNEEEQVEFERHMQSCVTCLRRYYFELHFYTVVVETLQENEVPPGLIERIRVALRSS